jgi:hypothetical protein
MPRTFSQQSEYQPSRGNSRKTCVRASFGIAAGFQLVGTLFARSTLEKRT